MKRAALLFVVLPFMMIAPWGCNAVGLRTNTFRVEGAAMQPAFCAGDIVHFHPVDGQIERWSIVVFKFPLDPSRDFIKRVVGLPGETVAVHDGAVYINGDPLTDDQYHLAETNYTYGPKTVLPDSYVVLGDNRRNSYDSHAWGNTCPAQQQCDFVPANYVLGKLPADAHGCKHPTTHTPAAPSAP